METELGTMGRGHEEQDPEEAAQHGGHPGQQQPGGQDRSVEGRNSAGMERQGPQKEEEAVAAARNREDNQGKEQPGRKGERLRQQSIRGG